MEIVIKIEDYDREWIANGHYIPDEINEKIAEAIIDGMVLPKGHGDLIDKSKICKAIPAEEDNCTGIEMTLDEMDAYNEGIDVMYSLVQGAKAIVEADESDDK